jgi:hypothetical protein
VLKFKMFNSGIKKRTAKSEERGEIPLREGVDGWYIDTYRELCEFLSSQTGGAVGRGLLYFQLAWMFLTLSSSLMSRGENLSR